MVSFLVWNRINHIFVAFIKRPLQKKFCSFNTTVEQAYFSRSLTKVFRTMSRVS